MQVIGLTGGIASGKSTVSYYLITHAMKSLMQMISHVMP